MNCEQMAAILPDYLRGSLAAAQAREVERHMAECAECRDDVAVWKKLEALPLESPSEAAGRRVDALMEAYQAGRADGLKSAAAEKAYAPAKRSFDWFRSPVAAAAWSMALLLLGVFGGNYFFSRAGSGARSEELAVMRSQLSDMKQLVVLSMLQQQSAGERLQGVSFSRNETAADPKVTGALLHTLRYDASVDVRLAALEALGRRAGQAQVRRGVTDALQSEQSPLVQVALIDQLVEWRDPDAAQRLRELEKSADLNPAVRQRAEWALTKLNERN